MTVLSPAAVRAAIDSVVEGFMTAFRRQDAAAIAALYSRNGALLPPGGEFTEGAAGIERFWKGAFEAGIAEAELETVELEVTGDVVWERGRYTLKTRTGDVADRGKYIVIWKQEGEQWKLHRDIWNSNIAPGT
jgi:uncharacterized protein (TIGR02246 family)